MYDAGLDPDKRQRLALLGAFRHAIKEDQLELYYQPASRLSRSIELIVDDLGTGDSSPSYLMKLPVNVIKIDQSLPSGLGIRQVANRQDCRFAHRIVDGEQPQPSVRILPNHRRLR